MSAAFWSNTIWFLILGLITVVQLFVLLKKTKNRKQVIAFFFIISGFTFCIEAAICCFLKAYSYYPMLIPQSSIDDKLAGNLFSQYSLTATALFFPVFKLNYYWFLILGGMYGIIEELFLKLGIYEHHWYRTWLTVIGLTFLFWLFNKMYHSTAIYRPSMRRYLFMALGLYSIHMPIFFWIQILTGIVRPSTTFLADPMNSYALISLANLFLLSIVCMFVYYAKLKWFWKLLITLALYGVIYLADTLNLLYIAEGWFLLFASIDIGGMYLSILILDKLLQPSLKFRKYIS
jgi:hypothetical protein